MVRALFAGAIVVGIGAVLALGSRHGGEATAVQPLPATPVHAVAVAPRLKIVARLVLPAHGSLRHVAVTQPKRAQIVVKPITIQRVAPVPQRTIRPSHAVAKSPKRKAPAKPPTRKPLPPVAPTTPTTPTTPTAPPETPPTTTPPALEQAAVVPPTVSLPVTETRPGNGYGDKNHDHTGPPGHLK